MADSHDQSSASILFEKKCFLQGELFSHWILTQAFIALCGSVSFPFIVCIFA
jgi:hypothetical protein